MASLHQGLSEWERPKHPTKIYIFSLVKTLEKLKYISLINVLLPTVQWWEGGGEVSCDLSAEP